jgi:hypothetical protein
MHGERMAVKSTKILFVVASIILSFAAAVVLAEVFLGVKEQYVGKSLPDYIDTKRPQGLGLGGYLKENFNAYVTDGLGGKVRWTTNAQGFRSDREYSQEPPPGVLRILSLGDSFNAGFRVGQNDTLAYRREEWINLEYGPAEILVVETEDPGRSLYYLDQFGLKFKPHVVILGITLGNDIVQAYQDLDSHGVYRITSHQGKMQIEAQNGSMIGFQQLAAYKIPPEYLQSESAAEKFIRRAGRWLERRRLLRPFYQQHEAITSWGDRDHLSLFDANNGFGVFANPTPPEIETAYERLFRILEAFATICRQHDVLFAVQIFPQRYQVQPEDWAKAVAEYGLNPSRFNLMGPNQKIAAFCREHGIICLDPTGAMARHYEKTQKVMYLPRGDMHWNKEGNQAYFESSLPAFVELVRAGFQKVHEPNPAPSPQVIRPAAPVDGSKNRDLTP